MLASLAADSPAEIAQSVALMAATRPGERRSVPDYGLPDPLGHGIDVDDLVDAIATWEDRADPAAVTAAAETIAADSGSPDAGMRVQRVTVVPADLTTTNLGSGSAAED